MKPKNLKLIARTKDDLRVVSAHLQDAIVNISDIANLEKNKIFLMQLNRFMWEDVEKGVFRKNKRIKFYENTLNINNSNLRFHEHNKNELAHYAKEAWDIEYKFPFGWSEIEGIHNRTDFDLNKHSEYSGKNLSYFDQPNNDRFVPYIIETSAGLNRMLLTTLTDSYWEDSENNRIVMRFHPRLAPIKAVVCPLLKKDGLPEKARMILDLLKPHFKVIFDQQGSIGKRYYRQDEAGTPFGITVDHQSLEDDSVTLRDRDTQKQSRLSIDRLVEKLMNSVQ